LEKREALILYFRAESVEIHLQRILLINTMLNNEMTVSLLQFTLHALNFFNEFNTLFQLASPKLHLIVARKNLKDLAQNFMLF
jgi:hypothetical protein